MSEAEKKKTTLLTLPNDVLFNCFARVSRSYYPTLSLVSKRFRSLLATPELYQTRSLLNRTETCLYVCLGPPSDPNPRWYTLERNPNGTPRKILVPNSIPNSPNGSTFVLGSDIYNIGGSSFGEHSSRVSIMYCWSHKWCEGPSMQVERNFPAVNVFDGKIYVAGGCKYYDPATWMEVFDPKTQIWEFVPCPLAARCRRCVYKSAMFDGTIYMFGSADDQVTYKPIEDRWKDEGWNLFGLDGRWSSFCSCVIDNILYSNVGRIRWFDSKMRTWRILIGLPNFERLGLCRLVDYGGKMAVFWDKCVPSDGDSRSSVIHCAVIALERRNSHQEIWGEVEWSSRVLKVPYDCVFIGKALAVTV